MSNRITLAMTGASGAQYGLALLKALIAADQQVYMLISKAALMVMATETDLQLPAGTSQQQTVLSEYSGAKQGQLQLYSREDWMSPVASGSGAPRRMVVCPCSTGTLSSIAVGACDNLIERAADVVLKERGQLILMVRETPFSSIHLQNMLTLSQAGAVIMPANPGFYHKPQVVSDLVDFMVARVLNQLGLSQSLLKPWPQS